VRDVDIDEVFELFRRGGPLAAAAGPGAARRVSNRRRRARLVAVIAGIVVAVAAPAVAYAVLPHTTEPDPGATPTPDASATATSPTVSPSVTGPSSTPSVEPTAGVPAASVLHESDVPAGYRYAGDDVDGDWTLEFASQFCAAPNNMSGAPGPTASWGAVFHTGTGPGSSAILQRVGRHSLAQAQTYFQNVRAMGQGCVPNTEVPTSLAITADSFAGDESLVLTWTGEGLDSTYVVVRVGELVTQIWYKDTSAPDPVMLGQRAAVRLCEDTIAC